MAMGNDRIEFATLKARRLSELVEKHIRELILNGELKPNDHLPTEKEMSAQFGVSAVTIREALRGLEALGLVEKKQGRSGGTIVKKIESGPVKRSMYDYLMSKRISAEQLLEARRSVDPSIAALAAQRINPETLQKMDANVRYREEKVKRAKKPLKDHVLRELTEKHLEFHRYIGESTNNPFLAMIVDSLMDVLWELRKKSDSPRGKFSVQVVKSHRMIFEILKKGDVSEARKAMESALDELITEFTKEKLSH